MEKSNYIFIFSALVCLSTSINIEASRLQRSLREFGGTKLGISLKTWVKEPVNSIFFERWAMTVGVITGYAFAQGLENRHVKKNLIASTGYAGGVLASITWLSKNTGPLAFACGTIAYPIVQKLKKIKFND